MNTLPLDLHSVLEFGLGGETWQGFVDHYNEKYNTLDVDGFVFDPLQVGYTFSQFLKSTGAATLPAYVDPESPGYEAALQEIEGKTGNIPTEKKYYRLNRVIVRQQLQLLQKVGRAAMTTEMQEAFMGLLDEGTDGLIQAYYNSRTHQRHRIVSEGKFVIDITNNPRGLKGITIDFIKADHRDTLTGDARWWTSDEHTPANEGASADPIQYMKDRVKVIRRKWHFVGRLKMELSRDLLDDILTHSKVLTRLGRSLYPGATDDAALAYAQNQGEELLVDTLRKIIKVDAIVARDSWAFVDKPDEAAKDIVTTLVENFKVTNISFIPDGIIGGFQGVEPLTLGYEPDKVASYDGGRLKLTQRAEPKTHSIYIESEAAQLAVPTTPHIFISTVTA